MRPRRRCRPRSSVHGHGSAQLNTAWNIRNRCTASSSGPTAGAARRGRCGRQPCAAGAQARRTASAAGCGAPLLVGLQHAAPGRRRQGRWAAARQAAGPSSSWRSALAPSLRTPTVATTGMPSSRSDRRSRSMAMPGARQVGHVQRHHAGQAQARTASTRRRLRRRLVASTTQTARSGRFSPARVAHQHVAVMASSG
jgi:hypothetical protein